MAAAQEKENRRMSQPTFAALAYANKKKKTRREQFLDEMGLVVPWEKLLQVVEPHYPKAGQGRPPLGMEKMLRIYFMQQWFNLSDPGMEDALYDMESLRRFAGIELGQDEVPDETTILNFRHLLERHQLTRKLFEQVSNHLEHQGLLVREGTIVDATIIAAPRSRKNASGQQDPEMSSTRKGTDWFFGHKLHVGTDSVRGLAHSAVVTTAKVHDSRVLPQLLHGQETVLYGDTAYVNRSRKRVYEARGLQWRVQRRAPRKAPLREVDREWNREQNKVRSKVEHIFQVIKHLWGHRKVRYRGLAKNEVHCLSLLALANLYLVRRQLLPLRA
jgi:IS5 family transposase